MKKKVFRERRANELLEKTIEKNKKIVEHIVKMEQFKKPKKSKKCKRGKIVWKQ